MGLFSKSATSFPWIRLTSEEQLEKLMQQSSDKPLLLFKHSTRCNISAMVISRFEREANELPEKCDCVYLDLLAFRPLSNKIEELTGVCHQSPQVLLIKNNEAVYDASHGAIDARKIESLV